jgi:hypothetical protein
MGSSWSDSGSNALIAEMDACPTNGSLMGSVLRAGRAALAIVLAGCAACSGGRSDAQEPPIITIQPADLATITCSDVEFQAGAVGTPPLAYQWLRSGVPIPGATTPSYRIVAAAPADAQALYSVRVTNALGTVVSREASLRLADLTGVEPVIIVAEPASRLAVSATSVVWSDSGRAYVHEAKAICGRPVASLFERTSIADSPTALVLFEGTVLWADGTRGGIWRSDPTDGTVQLVAPTQRPVLNMIRVGRDLYWTEPYGATVNFMPIEGGAVTYMPVHA